MEISSNFIVLGMAPGIMEDAKGIPFIGPAGGLLRRTFEQVGLDPKSAYYMNVVCCKPPKNILKPEWVNACRGNLKDQLDAAKARWVLACGNDAITALIPHANSHSKSKKIPIHNKLVYGVFHPSYIMRQKNDRGIYFAWKDELERFRLFLHDPGLGDILDSHTCMYCGSEKVAQKIPVCSKHIRTWRVDSLWKYQKPEQMTMEI